MKKYKLRFWFEHGGICLWSLNEYAKVIYGYAIKNDSLPISEELISELNFLEELYSTYLDWDCPQNPSLWTSEKKTDFLSRATKAYCALTTELGPDYEIVNAVDQCVV